MNQQKSSNTANSREVGEFPWAGEKAPRACTTLTSIEILRSRDSLMEDILSRDNMLAALKRVRSNNGVSGVDGMAVGELTGYLKESWPFIRERLLLGKYIPQKVRNVVIPKPHGGTRTLGIPTVLDRLIQQALLQVLQPYFETTFHGSSYGFRPGRGAHDALKAGQREVVHGKEIMIELDIEKFFDSVHHDRLMSKLKSHISDQRVLSLIRGYLNQGHMGLGLPQGGPLSPLLANIYLSDLDGELDKRKHSFVRYADDVVIFVRTQRAAARIKSSITKYLKSKLKLSVNESKSGYGSRAKLLGYILERRALRVTAENIKKFKDTIRAQTRIRGGRSMVQMISDLKPVIRGWGNYFSLQTEKRLFAKLDGWIRRRIRACYYNQLKNGQTRLGVFIQSGIQYERAYRCAYSGRGVWHNSRGDVMQEILNNRKLKGMGLVTLEH